jgi:hypothetical protein
MSAVLSACLAFWWNATGQSSEVLSSFFTDAHTVYHLRPATLPGGERGIIAAAYDGAVLCYTPQGRRLWIAKPGNDFPYDLCVADIDGDQRDEALVATAGGTLYAVDDEGSSLWSFHRPRRCFRSWIPTNWITAIFMCNRTKTGLLLFIGTKSARQKVGRDFGCGSWRRGLVFGRWLSLARRRGTRWSIWINTGTLTGSGSIHATGGNSGRVCWSHSNA